MHFPSGLRCCSQWSEEHRLRTVVLIAIPSSLVRNREKAGQRAEAVCPRPQG